MDPLTAGAIIGGGVSLINTASNWFTGKSNQRHSVDMWEKQQDYNKPVNQMARLGKAGINPHLAFSTGNINNVATNSPQVMPIQPGQFNPGDLETMANINQKKAQTEVAEAQSYLTILKQDEQQNRNEITYLESALEISRFPNRKEDPEGWQKAVEEYAEELQARNMQEQQVRKVILEMEKRLAKRNMVPGDSILYRALLGLADYMGFDIPTVN